MNEAVVKNYGSKEKPEFRFPNDAFGRWAFVDRKYSSALEPGALYRVREVGRSRKGTVFVRPLGVAFRPNEYPLDHTLVYREYSAVPGWWGDYKLLVTREPAVHIVNPSGLKRNALYSATGRGPLLARAIEAVLEGVYNGHAETDDLAVVETGQLLNVYMGGYEVPVLIPIRPGASHGVGLPCPILDTISPADRGSSGWWFYVGWGDSLLCVKHGKLFYPVCIIRRAEGPAGHVVYRGCDIEDNVIKPLQVLDFYKARKE